MMIALIPTKIGLVDVDKQTGDSQACLFLPENEIEFSNLFFKQYNVLIIVMNL